ncbi:MAG TPA: cupin domain-containing protein [Gemmatimonadales bacterium]|jgi:mannose-6-phosphate isomerase-like protein (cupin superfamily)|nr:cupin domain-containing protein [Gemmatimonadales bacterium]
MSDHVRQTEPFRWDGVEVRPYKAVGSHFAGVTRQVLFEGGDGLACQLRYFEIAPGGWSSLERHHHAHAVMIVRGGGRVLVGSRVFDAAVNDLVRVPSLTWHQFRATDSAPLGFLCVVDCERDVPERPDAAALAALRSDPACAAFLRV